MTNFLKVKIIGWINDFGTCLHLSIVTFSTIGYENITSESIGDYFTSTFVTISVSKHIVTIEPVVMIAFRL